MIKETYDQEDENMKRKNWYDTYRTLKLCGGNIAFVLEDDEDMIEIRYEDGMLIDIGKPSVSKDYFITVVAADDSDGWTNPLAEIAVADKADLFRVIQETIIQYRT